MEKSNVTKIRREKGDGSVRFNQSLNKWEARYVYGKLPNGKPDRRSRYANSESAAKKILREMRKESHNEGELSANKNKTVAEYFAQWLKSRKLELAENSFLRLEGTIESHIIPYIGMMRICDVTADVCQDIIFALVREKYSYSSIKKVYNALNACFRDAMYKNDIQKSPMLCVKLPEKNSNLLPPPKKMLPFSIEECRMLVYEAKRKYDTGRSVYRLGYLFILMLCTGIRVGEALALKWTDIDWQNKTIHIQRIAIVSDRNDKGTGTRKIETKIVDRTKTKSSNRYIGLNDLAIDALENLQSVTGVYEFIATNQHGGQVTARNFSKTFSELLKTLQLRQRGLHNLRHTFATQLFAKGVDVKIISELLGHCDVKITYDTYIHVIDSQKKKAIKSFNFLDEGSQVSGNDHDLAKEE